jgi:hypothetical protein
MHRLKLKDWLGEGVKIDLLCYTKVLHNGKKIGAVFEGN